MTQPRAYGCMCAGHTLQLSLLLAEAQERLDYLQTRVQKVRGTLDGLVEVMLDAGTVPDEATIVPSPPP